MVGPKMGPPGPIENFGWLEEFFSWFFVLRKKCPFWAILEVPMQWYQLTILVRVKGFAKNAKLVTHYLELGQNSWESLIIVLYSKMNFDMRTVKWGPMLTAWQISEATVWMKCRENVRCWAELILSPVRTLITTVTASASKKVHPKVRNHGGGPY